MALKRIIHFSDTHEPATLEHWHALFDKRMAGVFNSSVMRRKRHDLQLLPRAVEYILETRPDCVVFTGDATSCGQPGEFSRALKFFKPLLKSDIPFLYVPGNHDAYVRDRACVSALKRFTLALSRGKYSVEDYPFALEFDAFRIIALHCARPFNPVLSCGYMEPETVRFLMREAARLKKKPLICAGHFPILGRFSFASARRRLYGAGGAAGLLRDRIIDLSLCGHVHKPYELLDASGRGEIVAGSLTRYGTLAEITYDTEADTFRLRRIHLNR
ncbi:MAG: Calcineurin-like phosphoesterase superfamily domain protein [Lentisphaerae bacterium ADurb.Bin242]|nr:MAG: Calcineurin-like phosphoesterase superfamily domain protein [Lentisphaerae bacterium ADurb.Bin242]